ncbi:MAG: glycosyltransferase family 2 protein [Patescibacteria group bacterium]
MVKQISIIIVTWNVRPLLEANLRKIFDLKTPLLFEVIVIDNGSNDGSAAMVRDQFPQVKLIQNDWDAGFAHSCNQGLRIAHSDVCLLLNPDMLFDDGVLEKTYSELMNDKTIGVLGVKLTTGEGVPIQSVRRLPDLGSQVAIVLKLARFFPKLVARYMFADFDYQRSQDVDQVRGSYFAFRRELLESIGYLDEGYHLWFEEVDYCKRVQNAGMRIRYCTDVSCHDYVGKGFAKMKHGEKQRIFTASMVHYFQKWHPWWQTMVVRAVRPVGVVAAHVADVYESVTGKRV